MANTAGTTQTGSNKGGAQSVSLRVCTFKNGESLVEGSTANGDYFRTNVYADGYGWHTMFVKKTGHEQIWDTYKYDLEDPDHIDDLEREIEDMSQDLEDANEKVEKLEAKVKKLESKLAAA